MEPYPFSLTGSRPPAIDTPPRVVQTDDKTEDETNDEQILAATGRESTVTSRSRRSARNAPTNGVRTVELQIVGLLRGNRPDGGDASSRPITAEIETLAWETDLAHQDRPTLCLERSPTTAGPSLSASPSSSVSSPSSLYSLSSSNSPDYCLLGMHTSAFATTNISCQEEVLPTTQRTTPSKPPPPNDLADTPVAMTFAGAVSTPPPSPPTPSTHQWNTDTGATSHMTPRREFFRTYESYSAPIRVADGKVIWAVGKGTVAIRPHTNGRYLPIVTFSNVLHVPGLAVNLLSVLSLTTNHAYDVRILGRNISFHRKGELYFTATVNSSNTGYVDCETLSTDSALTIRAPTLGFNLWHQRFGHIGFDRLRSLVNSKMVLDLVIEDKSPPPSHCEPCIVGKHHRSPFPKSASNRTTTPLALVHSDLHGPINTQSRSGFRYWVTFIDDATRYRLVYFLKKKSDTFEAFKIFHAQAEKQTGHKLKIFRDDKGGEYMSTAFDIYLKQHGIVRQHTT